MIGGFNFKRFFGLSGVMVVGSVLVSVATHLPIMEGVGRAVPLALTAGGPRAATAPTLADRAAERRIVIQELPPPEVTVALSNVNTEETATFALRPDGALRPEQAPQVAYFFRCRRTGRQMPLAPGVLAVLEDVAKKWPGHVIEVVSGFRAPPYGAPHSKHFQGHAIDLRVRGVKSTVVRDYVWREHQQVGVGYYPHENFVHIDWRAGEQDTAWTGEGEDGAPQYRPSWAYRARHPHHGHAHAASHLVASNDSPSVQ
jgi:uncharacterized protein YcbK (DUF882 family)